MGADFGNRTALFVLAGTSVKDQIDLIAQMGHDLISVCGRGMSCQVGAGRYDGALGQTQQRGGDRVVRAPEADGAILIQRLNDIRIETVLLSTEIDRIEFENQGQRPGPSLSDQLLDAKPYLGDILTIAVAMAQMQRVVLLGLTAFDGIEPRDWLTFDAAGDAVHGLGGKRDQTAALKDAGGTLEGLYVGV